MRRGTVVARHLTTGPVTRTGWRKWLRQAETLAGIEYQEGRGGTGLRRLFVDEGKKRHISRDAMRRLGGWSDHRMADAVYADAEATYDRVEARDVRAAIRGETVTSTVTSRATDQESSNHAADGKQGNTTR